jgi:hypothetical protein
MANEFRDGFIGGFSLGIVTWAVWYATYTLLHTTEKLFCLPLAMGEWLVPTFWLFSKIKTEKEKWGFLFGQFCSLVLIGFIGLFIIGVT